jgi:hypothetical protein
MTKPDPAYARAITSKPLQTLLTTQDTDLEIVSTPRQALNGTIALAGLVAGNPVEYKITANGAVLSNRYVARQVSGETRSEIYRAGIQAVRELVSKRLAA